MTHFQAYRTPAGKIGRHPPRLRQRDQELIDRKSKRTTKIRDTRRAAATLAPPRRPRAPGREAHRVYPLLPIAKMEWYKRQQIIYFTDRMCILSIALGAFWRNWLDIYQNNS